MAALKKPDSAWTATPSMNTGSWELQVFFSCPTINYFYGRRRTFKDLGGGGARGGTLGNAKSAFSNGQAMTDTFASWIKRDLSRVLLTGLNAQISGRIFLWLPYKCTKFTEIFRGRPGVSGQLGTLFEAGYPGCIQTHSQSP